MINENDYAQVMEECFMTYIEGFIKHAKIGNRFSNKQIKDIVIKWTNFYLTKN